VGVKKRTLSAKADGTIVKKNAMKRNETIIFLCMIFLIEK